MICRINLHRLHLRFGQRWFWGQPSKTGYKYELILGVEQKLHLEGKSITLDPTFSSYQSPTCVTRSPIIVLLIKNEFLLTWIHKDGASEDFSKFRQMAIWAISCWLLWLFLGRPGTRFILIWFNFAHFRLAFLLDPLANVVAKKSRKIVNFFFFDFAIFEG